MKSDPLLHELPVCNILQSFTQEERQGLSSFGEFLLFKPGEMMDVAAKPAYTKIKVRALKNLKDMV